MATTESAQPLRELTGFLVSGALAFGVQIGLFNLLVHPTGALAANAISLCVATVVAFVFNRSVSFGHRRTSQRWRELIAFLVVNAAAIALSELVIVVGTDAGGAHGRLALNALTVVGAVLGLIVRFVAYRRLVFTGSPADVAVAAVAAGSEQNHTLVSTVPSAG